MIVRKCRRLIVQFILFSLFFWFLVFCFRFHYTQIRQTTIAGGSTAPSIIPLKVLIKSTVSSPYPGSKNTEVRSVSPKRTGVVQDRKYDTKPNFSDIQVFSDTNVVASKSALVAETIKNTDLRIPSTTKLNLESSSWSEFVKMPKTTPSKSVTFKAPPILQSYRCSGEIVANLSQKLDKQAFDWCNWAMSPNGGKVVVSR